MVKRRGSELHQCVRGINVFTKTKSNISIHLQIDNKTALCYVSNMAKYPQQTLTQHKQVNLAVLISKIDRDY